MCLDYLSVPVFCFSTKGGDFIVSSVAPNCAASRPLASAPSRKSFNFTGHFANKIWESWAVYYDDLVQALISAWKDTFASAQNMPKLNRPIPSVLSREGSTLGAAPWCRASTTALKKILRETELPGAMCEVRLASPMPCTALSDM